MSGGGSQTSTSSTTVPPQFLQAYQNTVNRAQSVASTPYQAYTGNLVAGFTPQQTQAQNQVSGLQGNYQPLLNQASNAIGASTAPLWGGVQQFSPGTIAQYENPGQQALVGATEAQIANTDAQQQSQLEGQAGAAGAFGGDRMGVAQGVLGGQQAVANNATLAQLNTQNYDTALGEFNQQQGAQLGANEANAWLQSQAGYGYGNLANEQNSLGLTDTSALAQSGLTQQQQAQAGLNTAYEQWQAQQAFPYQQTGWLANITEGIGSNVGGSSTTTQTNNWTGGRVPRAAGGGIAGYDGGGGVPYGSAPYGYGSPGISGSILGDTPDPATSYIPTASGGAGGGVGRGPPQAPQVQQQQNPWANPATDIAAASGGVSLYNNLFGGASAAPTTTQIGQAAVGPGWVLNAPAALDTTTSGPGFLGGLGSAVQAGAADVGSGLGAVGSAIGSGASAIGSGLEAAAAGGASLLGDIGTFFLSLFNRGGAVEPQHHARGGGVVVPFPQHRARGGVASGVMPYTEAPPVQATGTDGIPAPGYMGAANSPTALAGGSGGGVAPASAAPATWLTPSGGGTNVNPFSLNAPNPAFRKGGVVVPFRRAGGGGVSDYEDASNPLLGGVSANQISAHTDAPAAATATDVWDGPGMADTASPERSGVAQTPQPAFTPEHAPSWLPLAVGLATSALGEYHHNSHNIAAGALAGLNAYGQENQQYQGQKEKAVTLQQEAAKLADDAEFHREQIANENLRTQQTGQYQQVEGTARQKEADAAAQRAAAESQSAAAMANLREIEANRGDWTPAGTTPDGKQSVMTNRYTGEQKTVPLIAPTVYQQETNTKRQNANDIHAQANQIRQQIAASNLSEQQKRDEMKRTDEDLTNAVKLHGQDAFAMHPTNLTGAQAVTEAQQMRQQATGQPAPAQAAAPPIPTLSDPAQAAKLPSGSKFYDPNGVLRTVP